MLVRLRKPALELCRLVNIGDSGKVSLETVCILSLPLLTSRARLQWAGCVDSEAYTGQGLFSKNYQQHRSPLRSSPHVTTSSGTGSSTSQPEVRVGAHCRRLCSVPSDSIINVVMEVSKYIIGSSLPGGSHHTMSYPTQIHQTPSPSGCNTMEGMGPDQLTHPRQRLVYMWLALW